MEYLPQQPFDSDFRAPLQTVRPFLSHSRNNKHVSQFSRSGLPVPSLTWAGPRFLLSFWAGPPVPSLTWAGPRFLLSTGRISWFLRSPGQVPGSFTHLGGSPGSFAHLGGSPVPSLTWADLPVPSLTWAGPRFLHSPGPVPGSFTHLGGSPVPSLTWVGMSETNASRLDSPPAAGCGSSFFRITICTWKSYDVTGNTHE